MNISHNEESEVDLKTTADFDITKTSSLDRRRQCMQK